MEKTRNRAGKKISRRKTRSAKTTATRSRSAPAAAKPAATRRRPPAAAKASASRSRSGGTTNTTAKRSRAGSSGAGKTQQASGRKASQPAGKQQQHAGAAQRQGDSTMSPMFGGTKQVMIEEAAMTTRGGGRRAAGPEPYPFGELTPSRIENGTIVGPSFFVPNTDDPKKVIAAGRKRHKPTGKVYLTRQMDGPSADDPEVKVAGVRVWLAPADYGK